MLVRDEHKEGISLETNPTPYSHLKIFHHADRLAQIEAGKRTAPIYIRIKPTNVCNENCCYCHYKNAYLNLDEYIPSDYIPHDKMMEIIDDMRDMGVRAVTFSGGGEPLLYPFIGEAMQKILDTGIDLSIITNGILLKGECAKILAHAKWVRLSIDSSRPELYAQLRGVPESWFGDLCNNIHDFASLKDASCELGVNYVVSRDNYMYVLEMAKLMKSLGVNHVKFSPVINNETEQYHASIKERVIRELQEARTIENEHFRIIDLYSNDFARVQKGVMIFDRAYEKCYMKELICVIAANQKVYYCQDKAYLSSGVIADLSNKRFIDAWYSNEAIKKSQLFNVRTVCKEHCVHDDRNILLNHYFSIDKNHVNFL